jgi:hypothetical protein
MLQIPVKMPKEIETCYFSKILWKTAKEIRAVGPIHWHKDLSSTPGQTAVAKTHIPL